MSEPTPVLKRTTQKAVIYDRYADGEVTQSKQKGKTDAQRKAHLKEAARYTLMADNAEKRAAHIRGTLKG